MWQTVKTFAPAGAAGFAGAAIAAAVTDGRSLWVRVPVGVVAVGLALLGAHKLHLISLGAAAKAA